MLAYWAMKVISGLLCILPGFLRRIFAHFLGWLSWYIVPAWRRHMSIENIKECLGVDDARAAEIAEASVHRFGRMVIEVLRYPLLDKYNFTDIVKFNGLEYLDAAYKQNKGVIIATGHFGNWEMLGAALALLQYPILSITRKQNNGAMDRFINDYRKMVGQKVVYNHGENSMLAICRILKEKKLLGVLYDQDTGKDGIHLAIFGKACVVPPGAAELSRLMGSAILPCFIHNNEDGTMTVNFYPPLFTPKTADRKADVSGIMKELVVILEQEIIKYPSMWFWVHDRWKDGKARYRKFKKGEPV